MGSRSLPLLCPVTLSLRTLILYTRPYSENILVSSASSMDLGICPTNILMKSGSGCSGRLMLLKQAGNKEINRLWVQCLRVLGENHASKIRHPQDDKSESKFKVETLDMDTWRGTDHFMWASIKSLQSLHHHEIGISSFLIGSRTRNYYYYPGYAATGRYSEKITTAHFSLKSE